MFGQHGPDRFSKISEERHVRKNIALVLTYPLKIDTRLLEAIYTTRVIVTYRHYG